MRNDLDAEALARELVRAVRGKRSQVAFSRRLGCRSNVLHNWETGRRWPAPSLFFRACLLGGIDVRAALCGFYRGKPAWLDSTDPDTPEGIAALLGDLKGNTSQAELAAKSGLSRFAIRRYLQGQAEPKFPEFLLLLEVLSLRLLDFVAALVDPVALPSVRIRWKELQAARQAAYDLPWSHAVLRLLETQGYAQLTPASPDTTRRWLAARLGIAEAEAATCLSVLEGAGQVELREGRYAVSEEQLVDTQQDPAAGQRLKLWWAQVAVERLARGAKGRFSYNLFGVSAHDYDRIEELLLAYFRELRAIVGRSAPVERVALVNLQLLPLGEDHEPAHE